LGYHQHNDSDSHLKMTTSASVVFVTTVKFLVSFLFAEDRQSLSFVIIFFCFMFLSFSSTVIAYRID